MKKLVLRKEEAVDIEKLIDAKIETDSGVYKKPTNWNKTGEIYTYISGEDLDVNYSEEDKKYLKEGLNSYIEEVKAFKGGF